MYQLSEGFSIGRRSGVRPPSLVGGVKISLTLTEDSGPIRTAFSIVLSGKKFARRDFSLKPYSVREPFEASPVLCAFLDALNIRLYGRGRRILQYLDKVFAESARIIHFILQPTLGKVNAGACLAVRGNVVTNGRVASTIDDNAVLAV
jgi:hypothetical protein